MFPPPYGTCLFLGHYLAEFLGDQLKSRNKERTGQGVDDAQSVRHSGIGGHFAGAQRSSIAAVSMEPVCLFFEQTKTGIDNVGIVQNASVFFYFVEGNNDASGRSVRTMGRYGFHYV